MGLFGRKNENSTTDYELERLRQENRRLTRQIEELKAALAESGVEAPVANPYAVDAQERQLIAAGRKIEAIKHYRQRTDASLKDAKEAIELAESSL